MRNVDDLILEIRRETANVDNSNTVASDSVSDEEFIAALDDAQDKLQALISGAYADEFITETILSTVASQENYSIDDRVYLNARIHTIEYSQTGNVKDYVPISAARIRERNTVDGRPCVYIQRGGTILLNPIPNSAGSLRINYERELDDLDKRRAKVSSDPGSTITSISVTGADGAIDDLITGDYICVSDPDGNVVAYNIPVTSATSSIITVPSHTLAAGEQIDAGDYVTIGKYSTTHSKLPDDAERYLVAYAVWRILMREDADRYRDKEKDYKAIEREILQGYSDVNRDVQFIPILDTEIL